MISTQEIILLGANFFEKVFKFCLTELAKVCYNEIIEKKSESSKPDLERR